jgi:hypothetical protein
MPDFSVNCNILLCFETKTFLQNSFRLETKNNFQIMLRLETKNTFQTPIRLETKLAETLEMAVPLQSATRAADPQMKGATMRATMRRWMIEESYYPTSKFNMWIDLEAIFDFECCCLLAQ